MRNLGWILFCCVGLAVSTGRADWKDDVGLIRLHQTFTSGVPDAVTLGVTQVEAGYTINEYYRPDPNDPQIVGKNFTDQSTTQKSGVSWHATNVAYYFYGSSDSLIPATGAIDLYNANDWLTAIASTGFNETRRVQNHSWVSSYPTATYTFTQINDAVSYRNKLNDFYVNSDAYTCVVGMNNGSTSSTTLPHLLCQGYNQISVGLSNGNHTAGFTVYDGAGRIKPELVAPDPNYTSFATPKVASAAGLLDEKLSAAPYSLTGANLPLTIKALLLAGATKEKFPAWARTTARPLDLRYGAGELNILLAYQTLLAGKVAASNTQLRPASAWANASVKNNTSAASSTYYFEIPAGSSNARFSAALTWHRPVTQNNININTAPVLASLDLSLYPVTANTFTLGTLLDSSASAVDNVEHIYQATLAPGRYALRVTSASGTSTAYALAWRTSPTVTVTANTAEAREFDGTPGQFTLTRTGPTTNPLYVPLAFGGTAVSGTHYTAAPAGVLIPAGSASAVVSIAPVADLLAQGDRTVTLTIATDFALSVGAAASATVTIKDKPYDAWRFAKFTAPQLADPSVAASAADPDADGLTNLLEYAFAREPLSADSSAALPQIAIGPDDHLTFTYFQAADRPDLVFTPEWSGDLTGPWQSSATYLAELSRTATAGGETVTVRAVTAVATAPVQFIRLRVTRL